MKTSKLEELLFWQIKAYDMPMPIREYRFCDRRWKFDFAYPDIKLAVEVEGAIWTGGRHTRGVGFMNDCEKYNKAQLLGWIVLRYTSEDIKNLKAINEIKEAYLIALQRLKK